MPACNPIHSSLLSIAFQSSSSAASKWLICQAGQLQLNRAGGREHTAMSMWGQTGNEHAQALEVTWHLQQAAQEPCHPVYEGPSEPSAWDSASSSAERGPAPGCWEIRGPVKHSCPSVPSFRKHLVTGPLPRLAHSQLG